MKFNLQRFGGKGGTTIQSTYEPTQYELELQQLEVAFTRDVLVPHATYLAGTAKNLLQSAQNGVDSITTTIYGDWQAGINRINAAFEAMQAGTQYLVDGLETLEGGLNDLNEANELWRDDLGNFKSPHKIKSQFNSPKEIIVGNYENYIDNYKKISDLTNRKLEKTENYLPSAYFELAENIDGISGYWNNSTVPSGINDDMVFNLSNISAENYKDLDKLKPLLESALALNPDLDDFKNGLSGLSTLGSFYNNLDSLIPEYNENYQYARYADTVHSNFNDLIDGKLSDTWKSNMKDAVKTTLENTIGEVMNDLSARGVIESSMATQAVYDIERNASDEVAKMYLQNIQTTGQLVENRWQVKEQSLNDQKLILNELLGYYLQGKQLEFQALLHKIENINSTAMSLAQIFTQQFNNSEGAFNQQTGADNQKYSALLTGLNTQAQLYEQSFTNKLNALNSQFEILNKAYATESDTVEKTFQATKAVADTDWTHRITALEYMLKLFQARLQAIGTWDGTWESIIRAAAQPIALSSAATEAVQNPALRMWNASTGLNQSATGVLVAISNQGTRTQTTSQSGNFLGGLLSAGMSAFAGGFGMSMGKNALIQNN